MVDSELSGYGKGGTYWANTSSNHLVGKLIQEGSREIKISFERLLNGKSIRTTVEEQIAYEQLDMSERAVWSLLLASGYMKCCHMKNMIRWEKAFRNMN